MIQSPSISALATALAKAQGAIRPPVKNKSVKVQSNKGGSYSFRYATLDAVMEAVRKPLADNELSFSQDLFEGKLTTTLMHSSGEYITNSIPVEVQQTGMQALGSAISYARRYGLSTILGITADEDDDGNSADGNRVESFKGIGPPLKTEETPLGKVANLMKRKGLKLADLAAGGYSVNPRDMSEPELEKLIAWLEEQSNDPGV